MRLPCLTAFRRTQPSRLWFSIGPVTYGDDRVIGFTVVGPKRGVALYLDPLGGPR